jgi:hypothetical protein
MTVASTPDPARLSEYKARLATLVATKDVEADQNRDHKVKNLNRQIQAQLKWIARAEACVPTEAAA